MFRSVNIHVRGTVQGVGFRPFVYRIAMRNLVQGWVLNAPDGVHIHVEGDGELVESFLHDLEFEAPAASFISSIEVEDAPPERNASGAKFEIRESEQRDSAGAGGPGGSAKKRTRISPDLATCPDCLRELFDPSDRRYRYPFINCTNCGPRFTIIEGLPYDRPATSMREFEMCPQCASEYVDPADRRFHAQPDACFECGPKLSLRVGDDVRTGTTREESDTLIAEVAKLLAAGQIVAIKGLGGYHLACDASNEQAVATLRERKRRYGKPLAVMVRSVEEAQRYCKVGPEERRLLESMASPIVLLERLGASDAAPIAPSVAGTLHELGVVLPYTPVQHLLMHAVGFPLVMTSGNFTEEPIVSDNADAHRLLGGVADAFLDNDRAIVSRYDDSVVRVVGSHVQFVRRARGYAPAPLKFPIFGEGGECEGAAGTATGAGAAVASAAQLPAIMATGPQQKNTFGLLAGDIAADGTMEALVSQHVGDLENAETMDSWQATLELYEKMFDIEPAAIVCDMHPEYMTTKWAKSHVGPTGLPLVQVQHHHAHVAATLAENIAAGAADAKQQVIGVALDGTGYGEDGTIWGGEVMVGDCASYRRVAHLQTLAIVGGEQAIKHPSRLAYAVLHRDGLLDHPGARQLLDAIGDDQLALLPQMVERRLNCIDTSSTGRFFDAMSALLGICTDASFDGEAPMLLESAAYDPATNELVADPDPEGAAARYALEIAPATAAAAGDPAGKPLVLLTTPMVRAVLDDIASGVGTAAISLRIHRAVANGIARVCMQIRASEKARSLDTVALSGGVFMNRILLGATLDELREAGFEVLLPRELPPNDGCISYGQLAVAAARASQR